MKALIWSAVINGVVAVPLMAVIILLASKKSVMGEYKANHPIVIQGLIATGIIAFAAIGMLMNKRSIVISASGRGGIQRRSQEFRSLILEKEPRRY